MKIGIGKKYRYDTSNFTYFNPIKNKHLEICKLVYISCCVSNYGEAKFKDGEIYPVILEYLIPIEDIELNKLLKEKKKISIFDFEGIIK
ncbi:MAG: hypothetical protein GXO49_06385 [Chlorobi bacterium]|nr:hypothetical protein [Chlorobiota bacterium]